MSPESVAVQARVLVKLSAFISTKVRKLNLMTSRDGSNVSCVTFPTTPAEIQLAK